MEFSVTFFFISCRRSVTKKKPKRKIKKESPRSSIITQAESKISGWCTSSHHISSTSAPSIFFVNPERKSLGAPRTRALYDALYSIDIHTRLLPVYIWLHVRASIRPPLGPLDSLSLFSRPFLYLSLCLSLSLSTILCYMQSASSLRYTCTLGKTDGWTSKLCDLRRSLMTYVERTILL